MALAKERTTQDSHMGLIQACSFYGNLYGGTSVQVPDPSSVGLFGFENYHKTVLEEGEGSDKVCEALKNFAVSRLPSLSDPSNVNGIMFGNTDSPPEDAQSVINFKTGFDHWVHSSGSLLSFDQAERVSQTRCLKIHHEDENPIWEDVMDHNYQWEQQLNQNCGTDHCRLSEDLDCFETASSYGSMDNTAKDNQLGEERYGWLYSSGGVAAEIHQESRGPEANFHKRPHMGGETQFPKKHCTTGAPRKPKPKSIPSKDPQSIAAKNRRERISERLKILQDLVPNGAKVDLVTMLEKAISYVKFLQLQVKVLATDEFWPAQGGKAPEVAQVKEAIDAILSSHRDRNSSSK